MDSVLILKAMAALSVLGGVAAIMLGTAAVKFQVEIDPRVQAVLDALPGVNCGACGNPSCFAVAEGIAEERLPVTACTAGGQKAADGAAAVMGIEPPPVRMVVSCRMCGGGADAVRKYEYGGADSCSAVSKLAGGSLLCPSGCFGLGDCVRACPFRAMHLDARGLPVVDLAKCTGCGICVGDCPRGHAGLLTLIPDAAPVVVRCNTHDRGKTRRDYCSMTCISCRKCEKVCVPGAIQVIDNLAVVDYDKCDGCNACVEVCPPKCIDVTGRQVNLAVAVVDGAGPDFPGFVAAVPVGAAESDRA